MFVCVFTYNKKRFVTKGLLLFAAILHLMDKRFEFRLLVLYMILETFTLKGGIASLCSDIKDDQNIFLTLSQKWTVVLRLSLIHI